MKPMKRRIRWASRLGVSSLVVAGLVLVSTGGQARADGFDSVTLGPQPAQRINHFTVSTTKVLGHLQWEGSLLTHRDDDAIVLYDSEGNRVARVLDTQITSQVMGAIGVFDRLEFGFVAPLVVRQVGDAVPDYPQVDLPEAGRGVSDLRFVAKAALFGIQRWNSGGLSVSVQVDAWVPTGREDVLQGDMGYRYAPRLLVDWSLPGQIRTSLNLGFVSRPEYLFGGIEIDDATQWGLAASKGFGSSLRVISEMSGQIPTQVSVGETPGASMEWLSGVRYHVDDQIVVSGGWSWGIIPGVGTPDWRGFVGISWADFRDVDADVDGDGYLAKRDGCPDEPEDFDSFQDEDGCPDPDNDGDGVLDDVDLDSWVPEDLDGFEDEDGIPDLDNDQDGIADVDDADPNAPEDFDGFEDEDGAPEPDNDMDARLDEVDLCPRQAEVYNGINDEDGCPDEGGLVYVTCEAIITSDKVYFAPGRAKFYPASRSLLDDVASTLVNAPFLGVIRLDGHTDDTESRGPQARRLGKQRADAVRDYLISQGVDSARLVVESMAGDWPVAENDSRVGRAMNRRVEFSVLDPTTCRSVFDPDGTHFGWDDATSLLQK